MIFGGTAVQTLILAVITSRCDWEKEVMGDTEFSCIIIVSFSFCIFMHVIHLFQIRINLQAEKASLHVKKWTDAI